MLKCMLKFVCVDGLPGKRPERAMQTITRPLAKMNPKAVANVAGMEIWLNCVELKVVDCYLLGINILIIEVE